MQYQVTFTNPDTSGDDQYYFSSRQVAGSTSANDSDGPTSNIVTLSSGEYNDTLDAGLYRKGSIHAFGFLDINGDGIQNGGDSTFPEPPGKTLVRNGPGGTQTVTTVSGKANWTSLTPGTYTIVESPVPDGYALTTNPNLRAIIVQSGKEYV